MDQEHRPESACDTCGGPMVWSKVSYRPGRLHPDRVGQPLWVGSEACCLGALRDPNHPCRPTPDTALLDPVAAAAAG